MKKNVVFLFPVIIALCAVLLSCGDKEDSSSGSDESYTYSTTATAPQTWNPTDWQQSNESLVLDYTTMGLYDFIMNKTKDGYDIVPEMAAAFPVDVTGSYAGDTRFGVPSTASRNWAWKISLNRKACWEDGTPVTADSYIYSMQQFLNPEMKNYRASSWYDGVAALAHAKDYYDDKNGCTWDDVGLVKNDDYTITLIFEKPVTLFYVEYAAGSNWLLKKDLYEAGKKQTGDIVKSAYGTSKELYASYGPYKIAEYQPDKEMRLVRNEKWYGWTDQKHKDQFMTTGIYIQYIDKHTTDLALFLQGKTDDVGLSATDLDKYGNSDYIMFSPQSYTCKFSFNSDFSSLKKEEVSGVNHTILSYNDFRHAISLSLDRRKFIATSLPGSDPGYGLLNYLYVANVETGALYRDTQQAQDALCKFYGTNSVEDITGYDRAEASRYFQKAYDDCLKDGNISSEDRVEIDYHTYNAEDNNMRRVNFLQDAIDAAVEGTSLENRITVKQVTDENYYDNMIKGAVDCAFTAWGGAAFNPYGVLWCYSDPKAKLEYGFDPLHEQLTINLDGSEITKTYNMWYKELVSGEYATADFSVRNTILAANEAGILQTYDMVPLAYLNSSSLVSQRFRPGSMEYINSLVEHGGIRFATYSMDDAEWDAYCRKQNNQLSY
jgi:oligopeptide transport system substrate-binding protein